jgi:hypothetical protein
MQSWKEMVEKEKDYTCFSDKNIKWIDGGTIEVKGNPMKVVSIEDIYLWVVLRIKELEKKYFKLQDRIIVGNLEVGDAEIMHEISGQLIILRELKGE